MNQIHFYFSKQEILSRFDEDLLKRRVLKREELRSKRISRFSNLLLFSTFFQFDFKIIFEYFCGKLTSKAKIKRNSNRQFLPFSRFLTLPAQFL